MGLQLRLALDNSRVVWARDLGDAEDQKLLHYYPDRTVLLLEPDAAHHDGSVSSGAPKTRGETA